MRRLRPVLLDLIAPSTSPRVLGWVHYSLWGEAYFDGRFESAYEYACLSVERAAQTGHEYMLLCALEARLLAGSAVSGEITQPELAEVIGLARRHGLPRRARRWRSPRRRRPDRRAARSAPPIALARVTPVPAGDQSGEDRWPKHSNPRHHRCRPRRPNTLSWMATLELVAEQANWMGALLVAMTRPPGVAERRTDQDPWAPAPTPRPQRISDDLSWLRAAVDEPAAHGLLPLEGTGQTAAWASRETDAEVGGRLERLASRGVLDAAGFRFRSA